MKKYVTYNLCISENNLIQYRKMETVNNLNKRFTTQFHQI